MTRALSSSSSVHTIVVARGDTLSKIAQQAGVSVAALKAHNHLDDENKILAGQSLAVPNADELAHITQVQRATQRPEWKKATDAPVVVDVAGRAITVRTDPAATLAAPGPDQLALRDRERARGNDVAWLHTSGTLNDGAVSTRYRQERAFIHRSGQDAPQALAASLAKDTSTGLPLSSTVAKDLVAGTRFELKRDDAQHHVLQWRGDGKVDVTARAEPTAASTSSASVAARREVRASSHKKDHTFQLDLRTDDGRRAYDALVRGQTEPSTTQASPTDDVSGAVPAASADRADTSTRAQRRDQDGVRAEQLRAQVASPSADAPAVPSTSEAPTSTAVSPPASRAQTVASRATNAVLGAAWDAFTGSTHVVETPDTGTQRLQAKVSAEALTPAQRSTLQDEVAAEAKANGQELHVLRTSGLLRAMPLTSRGSERTSSPTADTTTTRTARDAATGELRFELSRPYVRDATDSPLSVTDDVVKGNTSQLPVTSANARLMPRGTEFTLAGRADVRLERTNTDTTTGGGATTARASGNTLHEARAVFKQRDQAEVTVTSTTQGLLEANASRARNTSSSTGTARLGRDQSVVRTFTLDLTTPAGREAWDAIYTMRPGAAEALASRNSSGVTMSEKRSDARTEGAARLTRTDTATGVSAAAGLAVDVRTTGNERSSRVAGDGTVRVAPPDSNTSTELVGKFERTRTVGADGAVVRTGELGGRLSVRRDAPAATDAADRGTTGSVGFSPEANRTYSLTLPAGSNADAALPVDAAQALALPQGARFRLTGTRGLEATADAARGQGTSSTSDARVQASVQQRVNVEVERGADNAVTVDIAVTTTGRENHRATAARTAPSSSTGPAPRLGLAVEGNRRRETTESARVTLQLNDPAQRAAYDAALNGDVQALRAFDAARSSSSSSSSSTSRTLEDNDGVQLDLAGNGAKAGLSLHRQVVDGASSEAHPARRALIEQAERDGKAIAFVTDTGVVSPGLSLTHTNAASTIAANTTGVRVGFDAGAVLSAQVTRPRIDGTIVGAASPPLTATAAAAFPAGAAFKLRGTGFVNTSVGVEAGPHLQQGRVDVGASVAITGTTSNTKSLEVSGVALGGGKLEMTLSSEDASSAELALLARAGVTVEKRTGEGLVNGVLQKVEDGVAEKLSARFEASAGQRRSNATQVSVVLDVNDPKQAAAYERFVRGDPGAAIAGTDRSLTTTSEDKTSARAQIDVAGKKVFLSEALRSNSTRVVATDGKTQRTDASSSERAFVFGTRDQTASVEAVSVRVDGEAEGRSMFRVRMRDKDRITSEQQVKVLQHFSTALGLTPDGPQRIEEDTDRGAWKLLGKHSKHGLTEARLDAYVTPQGFAAARAKTDDDAWAAAARFHGDTAGAKPPWADGAGAPSVRADLDRYIELTSSPGERSEHASELQWIENTYRNAHGKSIWEDVESYQHARSFTRMIGEMRGTADPVQWNKSFADHGHAVGFRAFESVGVLANLVGREHVVVHQFAVEGKAVQLKFKEADAPADPR